MLLASSVTATQREDRDGELLHALRFRRLDPLNSNVALLVMMMLAGRIEAMSMMMVATAGPGSFQSSNISGRAVLSQSPASGVKIHTSGSAADRAMHGRKRCAGARHRPRQPPLLWHASVAPLSAPYKVR